MTGAAPPLLEFEKTTKWYGSIAALLEVTFRVGTEVVGLVGRNGVGKSTLMKLAAGLLRPSQGKVQIEGRPAHARAARARMGFCPDVETLYEELSGAAFVAWMLRYHGLDARAARARAQEVLDELGLGDAMHRCIGEYSKGMRQRVRLAQALAHRPSLVLLDEPMTGLDPVARAELSATIRTLPGRGVGVLVSSHVLHELEAVVDRTVLVHQGRIVAQGSVAELRAQLPDRPSHVRLVVGEPRRLAAELATWAEVVEVRFVGTDAIEVATSGTAQFLPALTRLLARWPDVREVVPMRDDLATLFGEFLG
ncbi:MAG: ATP-binding cassette domain-containing protein [Planctomycetes bacterium]|nr:ATP-binding cassette domain-containing protein [Planctomycetota bacterium]